jgi:DNA-binding protein HU-beta
VNKGELIEALAETCELTKRDASDILDTTIDLIKKNTKKGGVSIAGFGSWTVSKRKARMGRNPQTGESIKIPAGKSVRFKAGKAFKEAV